MPLRFPQKSGKVEGGVVIRTNFELLNRLATERERSSGPLGRSMEAEVACGFEPIEKRLKPVGVARERCRRGAASNQWREVGVDAVRLSEDEFWRRVERSEEQVDRGDNDRDNEARSSPRR